MSDFKYLASHLFAFVCSCTRINLSVIMSDYRYLTSYLFAFAKIGDIQFFQDTDRSSSESSSTVVEIKLHHHICSKLRSTQHFSIMNYFLTRDVYIIHLCQVPRHSKTGLMTFWTYQLISAFTGSCVCQGIVKACILNNIIKIDVQAWHISGLYALLLRYR
jgi:hypothetical protein